MRPRLIALSLALVVSGVCFLSFSPELVIRLHIFLRFHPLEAFVANIDADKMVDPDYGRRFIVTYQSPASTNTIPTVYFLKQNQVGLWNLTTSGWGP